MPAIALLADVLPAMQPLDVFLAADESPLSRGIQKVTGGDAGHCMLVEEVLACDARLIETLGRGVTQMWLSSRVKDYAASDMGRLFWLPLSPAFRATLDEAAALGWLRDQIGVRYGAGQALMSGLSWRFPWIPKTESFRRSHCSELIIGAFKAGHGAGFEKWNASEANPKDVGQAQIYSDAVQVVWQAPLRHFNEVPPHLMAVGVNQD